MTSKHLKYQAHEATKTKSKGEVLLPTPEPTNGPEICRGNLKALTLSEQTLHLMQYPRKVVTSSGTPKDEIPNEHDKLRIASVPLQRRQHARSEENDRKQQQ